MSKSLRWSEKWFHRGLWLITLVFASFLVGLGSAIVGDLPRVEGQLQPEDFLDQRAAEPLRRAIETAATTQQQAQDALEQAELQHQVAQTAASAARESFTNWIATRRATEQPSQNAALIARTEALDKLKAEERTAQQAVQAQQQLLLDTSQAVEQSRSQLNLLDAQANAKWQDAERALALRVFFYRLAITLPLLALAGWLFARKRRGKYWPFVWGFIFFAIFTFFVELVPYLPSYGGYVRNGVGIILTLLIGRYAIMALQRYLQKQKLAEQEPAAQRRHNLSYDTTLARLAKSVCPSCERTVDLKDGKTDFCPHCGMGLFDHCPGCAARKGVFTNYCYACGVATQGITPSSTPSTPVSGAS